MGLYPQPNDWTCGPFALKHALITLGRLVPEQKLAALAKTHWWSGTDEIRLARAARAFGVRLEDMRTRSAEKARRLLVEQLRRGIPVLLCVDEWQHWICVVRYEASRFVIIDSKHDPVLSDVSWPQLRQRWRYYDVEYDPEDPPELYDLMPVVPEFRATAKADFSLARTRFLRRPENRLLATRWNEYLEDLLEICRPPSIRIVEPLSMAEFLRRNQDLILSRVLYWHGGIERRSLERLLRNLRFVAETYGLVIPSSAARRALTDIAILVTMTAVAREGIGDMYGFAE